MTDSKGEEPVSDDEILSLIRKHADKHDIPEEVLIEIYTKEKSVVGMDRRGTIFKDIDEILKNYVDNNLCSEDNS
jgi:hypothetical protein